MAEYRLKTMCELQLLSCRAFHELCSNYLFMSCWCKRKFSETCWKSILLSASTDELSRRNPEKWVL